MHETLPIKCSETFYKTIISIMTSVQSAPLFRENIEVGCDCFNPNLIQIITSVTASDYVRYKKSYVCKYLTNLVIHKSKDLVGLKRCLGKQTTKSRLLRSSYRSHQLTLRKFKEYSAANKKVINIVLSNSTSLPVEKYIQTTESVCKTFEDILSNIVGENNIIDIDLVIKSCQFQLQTLNIFEKIIEENGRSNATL